MFEKAMKMFLLFFFALLLCHPFSAFARPIKGFHEGPYLALQTGILQATDDRDNQAQTNVGHDIEPVFGFLFGWNLSDPFSLELSGQYATDFNAGRREHFILNGMNGRYSFIFDGLTDMKEMQIMPHLKAGASTRIMILPGNTFSSDQSVSSFAIGPSITAGISFLFKKYLSFGLDLREDFLFAQEKQQNLDLATPPLNNQLIYEGGFQPTFSAMVFIGIHY